jgi:4a-hydroxytetrahydrobiopterin dehydratase
VPALEPDVVRSLLRQIDGWEVVNEHHLSKELKFSDFATALAFVNRIGEIAEAEGHHPDLALSWGKVAIRIWTHKMNGLTESDFILAAKIDALTL